MILSLNFAKRIKKEMIDVDRYVLFFGFWLSVVTWPFAYPFQFGSVIEKGFWNSISYASLHLWSIHTSQKGKNIFLNGYSELNKIQVSL